MWAPVSLPALGAVSCPHQYGVLYQEQSAAPTQPAETENKAKIDLPTTSTQVCSLFERSCVSNCATLVMNVGFLALTHHMHTHALSLSLNHTHSLSLFLSHSLTHSLSLSLSLNHTLSLSLSLSHTHSLSGTGG